MSSTGIESVDKLEREWALFATRLSKREQAAWRLYDSALAVWEQLEPLGGIRAKRAMERLTRARVRLGLE